MATYYHNPNCTKSRKGLDMLKERNLEFTVKEYLKEPLSEEELDNLFLKLGKTPAEVVRKKEQSYQDLELSEKNLSSKEWCQIIMENPELLERPILLTEQKAIIGRPPELMLVLCD